MFVITRQKYGFAGVYVLNNIFLLKRWA